jgi:acyl-CoA reductase-like NAD-dependent aldehyde dehydrogenase
MQVGLDDGATLLTGGRRPPGVTKGYFIEPTVFINVKPHMRLWKEEVFGPVLSGEARVMCKVFVCL